MDSKAIPVSLICLPDHSGLEATLSSWVGYWLDFLSGQSIEWVPWLCGVSV